MEASSFLKRSSASVFQIESASMNFCAKLYGTQGIPLLKHLSQELCPLLTLHLILCFLHSAPTNQSLSLHYAKVLWPTCSRQGRFGFVRCVRSALDQFWVQSGPFVTLHTSLWSVWGHSDPSKVKRPRRLSFSAVKLQPFDILLYTINRPMASRK